MEGHRTRLREKYKKTGISAFHDYEIIEILLTYAVPRKDCKQMAKELLNQFKNISGVFNADLEELKKIKGIGDSVGIFFKIIKDINKIYLKEEKLQKNSINSTKELIEFLKSDMAFLKKEIFKAIFLDNSNRFIEEEVLFEGTIDRSHIYPREIVEKILRYNAKSVIFAHNHPSGNLKPSEQDIQITKKMKSILNSLDINLLDHVIVSENGVFSFLENNIL